jgi:flagellin
MVINTNIAADNAALMLQQNTTALNSAIAELSSGSKLTDPAADPAGSAVSLGLQAEINDTGAAANNVADASSFVQTQNGYLTQVSSALNRMSELSVSAQDVTKSNSDRALYQKEFSTLSSYISNIATQSFNGVSLFNGTALSVPIDANGGTFSMSGVNLGATVYTTAEAADVSTSAGAVTAENDVTSAINQLATDQATIGANAVRLQYTGDQLNVLQQNLTAANSVISDVDVATESTAYAQDNILVQSGTAMLAQAQVVPQDMLKLLGA